MNETKRGRCEVRLRVKNRQDRLPLLSRRRVPKMFTDTPRCPSFISSTILIVESHTLCTLASWAALTDPHAALGVYTGQALAHRCERAVRIDGLESAEMLESSEMLLVKSSGEVSSRAIRTKTGFKGAQAGHSHRGRIELSISADCLITLEVVLLEVARRIRRLACPLKEGDASPSLEPVQKRRCCSEIVSSSSIKPRINLLGVMYLAKMDVR